MINDPWWDYYLSSYYETESQDDYAHSFSSDWSDELDAKLTEISQRVNEEQSALDNIKLYSSNKVGERTKQVLSHCHPALALLHYTAIPRDPNNYGCIDGRRSIEGILDIMKNQDPSNPVTWIKTPQDSLHAARQARAEGKWKSWAVDIAITKNGVYRHEPKYYIDTWQTAILTAAQDLDISVFSGGRWDTPNALELNNGSDYVHTHLDPAQYPWVAIDKG